MAASEVRKVFKVYYVNLHALRQHVNSMQEVHSSAYEKEKEF